MDESASRKGRSIGWRRGLFAVAMAGVLGAGAARADAAEVRVNGDATFKTPADSMIAALPADGPLKADDLRAGTLSFDLVYDDATRDAEPDPYAGRYVGAIRRFVVRIGGTSIELPPESAQLLVSDGGFGLAHRESVQMLGETRYGPYVLRIGWVQLNQASTATDLRAAPGSIADDRIPAATRIARFATSGEFDRVLFVRLDPVADPRRPVLYLSTSALKVEATPLAGVGAAPTASTR